MKSSIWRSRKRSCSAPKATLSSCSWRYWSILLLPIMRPTTLIFIGLGLICGGFIPSANAFDAFENAKIMEQQQGPAAAADDAAAMERFYSYPPSPPSSNQQQQQQHHPFTRFGGFTTTSVNKPKSPATLTSTSSSSSSQSSSAAAGSEFYNRLVGSSGGGVGGVGDVGDAGGESFKTPIRSGEFAGGPWGRNLYPRVPEQGKPIESSTSAGMKMDKHGRVQMGVEDKDCDDGKTNLTRDWDFSPVDYTCFHPETRFPSDPNLQPLLHCVDLPTEYRPNHLCMDASITYTDKIPTYGDHRPLWPKFGEYLYVPKQRWLHNIEHGAVVVLYHPCAHPEEVKQLKSIVTHCYGKHVITPSTDVDPERPLQLVAWGCSLKMAVVDEPLVIKFIHEKSMKGPEGPYTKEGQFEFGLLRPANETKGSRYDRITCASPVM